MGLPHADAQEHSNHSLVSCCLFSLMSTNPSIKGRRPQTQSISHFLRHGSCKDRGAIPKLLLLVRACTQIIRPSDRKEARRSVTADFASLVVSQQEIFFTTDSMLHIFLSNTMFFVLTENIRITILSLIY